MGMFSYLLLMFLLCFVYWKLMGWTDTNAGMKIFKYITAGLLLLAFLPLPNAYHTILGYFLAIASIICAMDAFDQLDIPWIVAFGIIAFINGLAIPLSVVSPLFPETIFLPTFIDNEPNHWRVVFYFLAAVVFSLNAITRKKY